MLSPEGHFSRRRLAPSTWGFGCPFLVLEGVGVTGVERIARIRFEQFQNRKGIKRILIDELG